MRLPCVRHLDGIASNNDVRNLAWGTYADNEADKIQHGTWDLRRTGKLSVEMRKGAISLLSEGWSQTAVANLMNVSRPTINMLVNGRTWGNAG
jgi:predicted XRE-type DNA-binding protein